MSVNVLKTQLKSGKLVNLYLFYGPEEYLKKYYLNSIEKKLIGNELAELNKIVLESKVDVDKLIESCEALPVFSDYKLVVARNSGFFKPRKRGDDGNVESNIKEDALVSYLEKLPPYTCLVFYEDEVDNRLKITGLIKKKGLVVEFSYQKPADLIKWVKKVFRANGKEINDDAASMLIEYCEPGMTDILNEIEKLSLYKWDNKIITTADVEQICTKSVKGRIFDLTDAVVEKNGERALKLLNELILLKEPIPKIFFMIIRQLRILLQMKLLNEEGVPLDEAASRLSLSPYAARKIIAQSKRFNNVDKLADALEECLNYDLAVKTGIMDDRIAVELLITKLANL